MEDLERDEIDYFGGCPLCGKNVGYLNLGPSHWFVCHEHRTKWWGGSNLFSTWKAEGEADRNENWQTLRQYQEVMPLERESRNI